MIGIDKDRDGKLARQGRTSAKPAGTTAPVSAASTAPVDGIVRVTRPSAATPPRAQPAARPQDQDPAVLLVDTLLPSVDVAVRAALVRPLQDAVATCLDGAWQALLARMQPALEQADLDRLSAQGPDAAASVPRLVAELEMPAALALLAPSVGSNDVIMRSLLDDPRPQLREAALDLSWADPAGATLGRLEHSCDALSRSHLSAALDRLKLSHAARQALSETLQPGEGVSDVPGGAMRPASGEAGASEAIAAALPPSAKDDASLQAALQDGDHVTAIAILSAAALVPQQAVLRAIRLRNARGLVSLAWKAGFSARTAVLLQTELGGVSPEAAVSRDPDGTDRPSRNEMAWQISFLSKVID